MISNIKENFDLIYLRENKKKTIKLLIYNFLAIRQAISKALVAYYQKCKIIFFLLIHNSLFA